MFEPDKLDPEKFGAKRDRRLIEAPRFENSAELTNQGQREPQQRRMMVIALALLMIALGFVLYRDRDFWFPDTQDAMDAEAAPATRTSTATASPTQPGIAKTTTPMVASKPHRTVITYPENASTPAAASDPPAAQIQRTVLPPLEVEVVAGDAHRTLRPGSNSVQVDLQRPGSSGQEIPETAAPSTTPSLTKASEHVEMSADTTQMVSRSVRPGYPMLARQMKVQGSVILQALISRDGSIQDLQVMSGPPILAGAAREAVKQWRFKPHYMGSEAVETQAKITVNFTISTN
jgi:protein TonB